METRKFVGYATTKVEAGKQITRMTGGKRDTLSNWIRLKAVVVPVNLMKRGEILKDYEFPAELRRLFRWKGRRGEDDGAIIEGVGCVLQWAAGGAEEGSGDD
jgi:hypothetical protein